MANTPLWSFRIPADLRERVVAKAKERGENVTEHVVLKALREYDEGTSPTALPAVGDPFMPPPEPSRR